MSFTHFFEINSRLMSIYIFKLQYRIHITKRVVSIFLGNNQYNAWCYVTISTVMILNNYFIFFCPWRWIQTVKVNVELVGFGAKVVTPWCYNSILYISIIFLPHKQKLYMLFLLQEKLLPSSINHIANVAILIYHLEYVYIVILRYSKSYYVKKIQETPYFLIY